MKTSLQIAIDRAIHAENARKWRGKNPESVKRSILKYSENNKEKIRARKRDCLANIRKEIIEMLGGDNCANPYHIDHGGFKNDIRCLQIDHVNGGGVSEMKSLRGGTYVYYRNILRKIKSGSKDYQLLCANCNWIKKVINGEHPRRL